MATDLFQAIGEKAKVLKDLKIRFDVLMERTEDARKRGQTISLPEFEAFGWAKFGEFLNRLEDSLNSPLLERVRDILEKTDVTLSPQMIERLKAGLTVRGERLVEIAKQTAKELKAIVIAEVQEKAKQDIVVCLEEGKWDNLVGKVTEWRQLERQLIPIANERAKNTLLYNAVFEQALQEGPLTKIVQKLRELENTAGNLGGDILKQQIRSEEPEGLTNPLASIENNLTKVAQEKEDLRRLQGGDVEVDRLMLEGATLKRVIDTLKKELRKANEEFDKESRCARELLEKRNNLAALFKQMPRSMVSDSDIKRLKGFKGELESEIRKLSQNLEKSLSSDARIFIESVTDSKLPNGWEERRVVKAIKELLGKGFSFEVKRKA